MRGLGVRGSVPHPGKYCRKEKDREPVSRCLISSNDPRKKPHRAVKALASNIGVKFKSHFPRQRFRSTCSIEIVDYRLFVVVQTSIDFRKIFARFGHHKNSFLSEMNCQEIKKNSNALAFGTRPLIG